MDDTFSIVFVTYCYQNISSVGVRLLPVVVIHLSSQRDFTDDLLMILPSNGRFGRKSSVSVKLRMQGCYNLCQVWKDKKII